MDQVERSGHEGLHSQYLLIQRYDHGLDRTSSRQVL
jgi:hypothetical protein